MISIPRPDPEKSCNSILDVWNRLREELKSFLESIPRDLWNQKPGDGSWSPAETADHLQVTQALYGTLLLLVSKGKRKEACKEYTLDYDSIENVYEKEQLKNPEAVDPGENIDPDLLLDNLDKAMEKTKNNLNLLDQNGLFQICFEHPFCGKISMMDWLWVLTLHERHHLEIMKRKYQK